MNTTILVAIIAASTSIITASIAFVLNKREERKEIIFQRKLQYYHELINSITNLLVSKGDASIKEANTNFAKAYNIIALVAPTEVINALIEYHDEIQLSNEKRTNESHEKKLNNLFLTIRKSLELPFKDEPSNFKVRFIG